MKGKNLADPLSQSGEFPPLMVRMIGIGERTGEMEQMLWKHPKPTTRESTAKSQHSLRCWSPSLLLSSVGLSVW